MQTEQQTLPFTELVIVAAEASKLSYELGSLQSSNEIPKLLTDLLQSSDLRVSAFPMQFANVLHPALLPLHVGGVLYDAGFSRQTTLSMVVNTSNGTVLTVELPQNILEVSPQFASELTSESSGGTSGV